MAVATRICKVCGKEYEYCHTVRRVDGVFRYQDVACCPEHGSIYFERIDKSRAPEAQSETLAESTSFYRSFPVEDVVYEDSFDDEEDDEEDEEDDDEDEEFDEELVL